MAKGIRGGHFDSYIEIFHTLYKTEIIVIYPKTNAQVVHGPYWTTSQ